MAKVIVFEVEFRGIKGAVTNTDSLTNAIKRTKQEIRNTDFGTEKYRQLDKQLAGLQAQQKLLRDETRKQKKEFEASALGGTRSYRALQAQLQQLENEYKDLTEAERKSARGRELSKKVRNLRGEIRGLNEELGKKGLSGAFREAFTTLGGVDIGRLATIGGAVTLAAQGLRSLGRFVGDSIQVYADFNRQISFLGAVSGASADELAALEEQARQLGETTQFSASQVAQLEIEYAKLGFTPAEILAATADTLNLATVAQSDLGETTAVTASVLRAFNLDASEAKRVTDVASLAFSSSALDLSKFSTAMAAVAPVAASANVSLEDTTALLGVLVDAGLDPSTAGTGLRNVFLDIAAEGITLEEALSQITNASDSNVKALELFGKRGATVGTVLAANAERAAALGEELKNSEGFAEDAADVIEADLRGALDTLNSTLEGAKLNLIETFQIAVTAAIKGITNLVKSISAFFVILRQLPAFLDENKVAIGALAVAIISLNGAAIAANATLLISRARTLAYTAVQQGAAIATNLWTAAQRGLNFALRNNPIGLVITGISLLVAGLTTAYKRSETFRATIDGLGRVAGEFFQIIKESFGAFIETFRRIGEGDFRGAVQSFGEVLEKGNPIRIALTQGSRLADAYREGYEESIEASQVPAPEVEEPEIIKLSNEELEQYKKDLEETAELTDQAGQTINQLQAKLKGLKEQLEDEAIGSKEFNALKKEIAETEAAIKRFTSSTDQAATQTDAFATGSIADLRGKVSELKQELERAAPENQEGILRRILDAEGALDEAEEYQKALREALFNRENFAPLEEIGQVSFVPDPDDIPLDAILQRIEEIKLKRIEAARETASAEEEFINQRRLIELEAEREILQAKIDRGETEGNELLQLQQELADKTVEIQAEKNEQILELERERAKQIEELERGIFDAITTANDIASDASQRRADSQIRSLEESYGREIDLAEGNTERQEQLQEELDQKKAEVERREFERQKQYQVAAALISLAQGIINTLAAPTTIPDPFGTAFKVFRIGVLTATTANQIANINAQTAEEGILVAEQPDQVELTRAIASGRIINNTLVGATHGDPSGGIRMRIRGIPIIAEHGERIATDEHGGVAIVNKRSSAKFKKQLDAIQNVSFEGKRSYLSMINNHRNWGIPYVAQGAMIEPAAAAITAASASGSLQSGGFVEARVSEESAQRIAEMTANAVGSAARSAIGNGLGDANRRLEREDRLRQRTKINNQ